MSITNRARAEAERRGRDYTGDGHEGEAYEDGFVAGATWAASLPPTDEEVEAAARSLAEDDGLDWSASATPTGVYRAYARAALIAAREAQR